MIKVTYKDDNGNVIRKMEYPMNAVLGTPDPAKEEKEKVSLGMMAGKAIGNLIINQVKDKYFGGLL